MKHTLSVLVQNEAGVLSSLSGLFSGRGYNIESLTVAPTIDNEYSRVTIVTHGDEKVIEQICKQLHRLIYTLKVAEISPENSVSRELVLLKVTAKDEDRSEILRIAEIFESKIVDDRAVIDTSALLIDVLDLINSGVMIEEIACDKYAYIVFLYI